MARQSLGRNGVREGCLIEKYNVGKGSLHAARCCALFLIRLCIYISPREAGDDLRHEHATGLRGGLGHNGTGGSHILRLKPKHGQRCHHHQSDGFPGTRHISHVSHRVSGPRRHALNKHGASRKAQARAAGSRVEAQRTAAASCNGDQLKNRF